MPEGHTLHRLAGELSRIFGGHVVRVTSPQGRFAESAALLDGAVLAGAQAWGKQLFVDFGEDRFVQVHLGLYGTFAVHAVHPDPDPDEDGDHHDTDPGDTDPGSVVPEPVGQVRLRLVRADAGAWADLRGATTCALVTGAQRDAVVARSGPDPLRADADPGRAWQRIRASRSPIGGLLMDQSVLAGVGNVYRAEVLFRQRLDPLRPGNTLRRGQWQAVWDDLVELMAEGVRTGRIDTVRAEHTPEAMGRAPRKDDHGGEVYVYRRHGQPCLQCGTLVRTEVLGGRNLFWCPRCQPRFRSRAAASS